jgi:hypothetical protein
VSASLVETIMYHEDKRGAENDHHAADSTEERLVGIIVLFEFCLWVNMHKIHTSCRSGVFLITRFEARRNNHVVVSGIMEV